VSDHNGATYTAFAAEGDPTMDMLDRMLDRGANGGVAGDPLSVRVINMIPHTFIDIQGIDGHTLSRVPVGTFGCVVPTQRGDVILILHQYALHMKGKTIHSCIQMEDFSTTVNDTAIAFGGLQNIITLEGYIIPLDITNGLVNMRSRAFTDDEWNDLPHVVVTRDAPWNPRAHDLNVSNNSVRYAQREEPPHDITNDTQLVQDYLANIAFTTACNPQEPSMDGITVDLYVGDIVFHFPRHLRFRQYLIRANAAAGINRLSYVRGVHHPADILSRRWA
jgi:hypothetical protein